MSSGSGATWRTSGLRAAVIVATLSASGCGGDPLDQGLETLLVRPETAVDYDVVLHGAPTEEIADLAEQSLDLYRQQDDGAPSEAFLLARAESDIDTMQRILRSRGYYLAAIEVAVELIVDPDEKPGEGRAVAAMTIDPGPPFILTRHDLDVAGVGEVPPPVPDAADLGSPVGGVARAAEIASAESGAVAVLKERGYPYADYLRRSGLADPEAATLEVTSFISAGPAAVFGDVDFLGLGAVEEGYLRTYLTWEPGETFDSEKLREFQRALLATDLFTVVTAEPPATPPGESEPVVLPITATVEERLPRTVAGSFRYETDTGPSARISFEHRNLFGANETFRAEAEGGLTEQRLAFAYREPQFLRPGQDLLASLEFERTRDDAFDADTVTAFTGLERELSRKWTIGLGLLAEASLITDAGVESESYLLGIPFFAAFDDTDDPLDPVRGERLRVEVTPFGGTFDSDPVGFLSLDATGSVYRPLDDDGRYVIAGFARAGSILSGSLADIPPTRRFYAGGGGSVRGYSQDFVGPLDAANDPIGGRSVLVGGVELRARIWGDIGGVVFVEGGSVSRDMIPSFEAGFQIGAGIGFRYYSPAGPIRLDIGVPVNGRDADDAFQVYFSIGQAF